MAPKKRELAHPSDIVGTERMIRWDDLKDGMEYEFLLLSYYSSKVHAFGNGGYLDVAAISLKEQGDIEDGEVLAASFPYRTFLNAMYAVPRKMKLSITREIMGEGDLYIKFVRQDLRNMKIIALERRETTEEKKQQAQRIFDLRRIWE